MLLMSLTGSNHIVVTSENTTFGPEAASGLLPNDLSLVFCLLARQSFIVGSRQVSSCSHDYCIFHFFLPSFASYYGESAPTALDTRTPYSLRL